MQNKAIICLCVAGLAAYLILSIVVYPSNYLHQYFSPRNPNPSISLVQLGQEHILLGQDDEVRVMSTNNGDDADMQTISLGFPNLTSSDNIDVLKENLPQKPIMISRGSTIGFGYSGTSQSVKATYAAIEAQSWPWEHGKSYEIDVRVRPQSEGTFLVFVKSVAMPESSQISHFPQSGTIDQQGEFVQVYKIQVAKS